VPRKCAFNHGGAAVPGMTQNVLIDNWGAGFSIGKAAGAWIRARRGGHATVLLLRDSGVPAKERADGIGAGLQIAAPQARVRRARARTSAEGAALARGAAVVVATNVAPAIGAASVLGVHFVGSVGINGHALQMIERGGAFKIAWSFYEVLSGVRLLDDVLRCLSGHHVAPERTLIGGGVTRGTVAAFRNAVAHPLAPGTRSVYARVMRDCSCAVG
jgi:hypothetical protein